MCIYWERGRAPFVLHEAPNPHTVSLPVIMPISSETQ